MLPMFILIPIMTPSHPADVWTWMLSVCLLITNIQLTSGPGCYPVSVDYL